MYNYDYSKLHKKYIRGALLHFTMSDEDVSDSLTTQIAQRDIYYSELLRNHMSLTKARGICKEVHKWLFFWLIVGACCVGIFYIRKIFATVFAANDVDVVVDAVPLIITALVSLISTIIVVPVTIAKFLFNTNEDDNITTLIQHTQDHDSAGITMFKERFLPRTKKTGLQSIDSDDQ